VDECKPLVLGGSSIVPQRERLDPVFAGSGVGRGLHSLTSELNLRTFGTHRSR